MPAKFDSNRALPQDVVVVTTRRTTLRLAGTLGVSLLAGCFGVDSDPKPGSLVVTNNDDEAHTLVLDIRRGGQVRRETVTIGPSEWGIRNNLLTEPGTYTVTVAIDGTESVTATVEVEITRGTNGLGGENLEVVIGRNGGLTVSVARYD